MRRFSSIISYLLVITVITGLVAMHYIKINQPRQQALPLTPESLEEIIAENQRILRQLQKTREQLLLQQSSGAT